MSKPRFGCMIAALVLLLFFSIVFNIVLIAAKSHRMPGRRFMTPRAPQFEEQTVANAAGSTGDKIALITLRGLISASLGGTLGETMVEDLKIALRQAVDDPNVKAIVLNIDSPGGEVTASDEIYDSVKRARDKKPVVVYMSSLAASGGYYVSCGGTW
ncbi:MAG: protease, partial [Chthoniobacter sp.]|nr:protease [Chthoniobacter sp.]